MITSHGRGGGEALSLLADRFSMTFEIVEEDDAAGELEPAEVEVATYLVVGPAEVCR